MHPITWISAFAALFCLLCGIQYGRLKHFAGAVGFTLAAIVLGIASAVSSAMTGGGYLAP